MIVKKDNLYFEYPKSVTYTQTDICSAPHWFFILTTGRTGSTILTKLLSLHPEIHCANEQNMLPLLSTLLKSKLYIREKPRLRYSSENQEVVDPKTLRTLMEAWKSTQTSKIYFGDKDLSYGKDYSSITDLVFPNNKKILSTRHILDQLSSLYSQKWYTRLPKNRSDRFRHIKNDVLIKTTYAKNWVNKCDVVIPFEKFSNENDSKDTLYKILEVIGVDKKVYPIEEATALCIHSQSIGRWKNDKLILDFISQLKLKDSDLYSEVIEPIA